MKESKIEEKKGKKLMMVQMRTNKIIADYTGALNAEKLN